MPSTWFLPVESIPYSRAVSSAMIPLEGSESSRVLAPDVAAASAAFCMLARTRSTLPMSITRPASAMITTMNTATIGSVWPRSLRRGSGVGLTHRVIDPGQCPLSRRR